MGSLRDLRHRLKLDRRSLIARLPRPWQFVLRYRSAYKEPQIAWRPKTYHQKMYFKLLFDRRPLLTTFADKLLAREYVRAKLGDDILIELFATADKPEEIQFENLPPAFVLKANHGSGFGRIVRNMSRENPAGLRALCHKWLSQNYGDLSDEWAYKNIQPRLLVERLLDAGAGQIPADYKFFVFNGRAFMIQVDVDRFSDHRRDFFDRNWVRIDARFLYPNATRAIPKPACLEKMLGIAESLGAEIDFVRVDLYEVEGRVYFGELTNYPEGGHCYFEPQELETVLGSQWSLHGY